MTTSKSPFYQGLAVRFGTALTARELALILLLDRAEDIVKALKKKVAALETALQTTAR
jgi:hypothetical protein